MKKILLLVAGMFILSCTGDDSDCCTIIDTGVAIKYVNEDGENLLEIDRGFSETEVTIYHNVNNEWIKYFEGNLDSPKGISTVDREDGTYLVIFPSTHIVENSYSETKIEFSETDSDILRTEISKSNSSQMVTKVWYNGELKWEAVDSERVFEVLK